MCSSDLQRLLISSGHATRVSALPAAIAASLVHPNQTVVAFTGDGGLGMVVSELETVARLGLPVVVVVFNDSLLSLIAVKQDEDSQGGRAVVEYQRCDFAEVARGFGVESFVANNAEDLRQALTVAVASKRPALIDVTVDPTSYSAVFAALRE